MTAGLLVLVPILGSFIAHAPVLRFDLLPSLRRPLDGGRSFRGRRIFGDNKTWRGALVMFAGVVAATAVLSLWPAWWRRLPPEIQDAGPWCFGVLLGLGVVVGELPNSFLKRQLDIAPGARRRSALGVVLSIFDQGDFVVGIWLFLAPIWTMTPLQALVDFLALVVAHLAVSAVGVAIGARRTWL